MKGMSRGTVIEKDSPFDLERGAHVYVLKLRCEEDAACEVSLVVSKEMYDAACIEGLGQDTVVEYGTVLRVVSVQSSE